MPNPSASRISPVLIVVLIAALAAGAAASILVEASTAPPPTNGPTSQVLLPVWVFVVAVLGLLVAILVAWAVIRLGSGSTFANRTLILGLITILIISLFVVGLRVFGVGGPPPPVGTPVTTNTSANGTSGHTGGLGNATNLSGLGSYNLFPSVPPWVPFVVLGIIVLLLAAVALPRTREYLAERKERLPPPGVPLAPSEVLAALHRASSELDLGGDPRLIILALYSEMLVHLQPMVGSVDTSTPEEIRSLHLTRLGVRPDAAKSLTRLFEEARYSTHLMGPKELAAARSAVRATLEDLGRKASVR